MTDLNDIHFKIAKLRAEFIKSEPYNRLWDQFDRQIQRRRANLSLGLYGEARGLAVVGAPGSGKSTLVNRLLNQYPDLSQPQPEQMRAELISLLVPSPATLKYVGSAMLCGLGYPLTRDKPAGFIWDQVRDLLHKRETLFVHLDEAQDLFSTKNLNTRGDVVNTLKSLMNNRVWPVGLILSGTPKMLEMINSDDQLKRRIDMINLDTVSWSTHGTEVRETFLAYAAKAGLSICPKLQLNDFLPRLVHAGCNELGLIIEMILSGIENALLAQSDALRIDHFVDAFQRKSGCSRGLNIFVVSDYLAIDPRAVMRNTDHPGVGAR